MACENMYIPVTERSEEDILNERRDDVLKKLESELGMGLARIVQDPFTGSITIEGASEMPEGMSDVCVLDALNLRNSMEFQLATANPGLQGYDFASAHGHKH